MRGGAPTPTRLRIDSARQFRDRFAQASTSYCGFSSAAAFGRRLERLGNHQCDRLVDVAHSIVLQHLDAKPEGRHFLVRIMRQWRAIGRRQHLDDAGMRLGCGHVERGHTAARNPADGRDGVEHAVRVVVGGIGGARR